MKKLYLDIIEKSLSAYTDERIRNYIDEVRRDGLKEHGFPRLGANMGILIAYGRKTDMLDTFIEIMDICCDEMPRKKAANDFSIREVCCCLLLLEEKHIINAELLENWKNKLSRFDPWKYYDVIDDHSGKFVGNWALFAAVSEYMRGVYCGIDTSEFVDWQIPSQLANLDLNDMYKDAGPEHCRAHPFVYDLVPRILFAFLLRAGYKGKYAARIEQILDNTADITLKMQSVTGEIPFGGRSNQFIHNDTMLCAYCEMEAVRFKQKGDLKKAGEFKAAATLAAEKATEYLELQPISHIKNRYDIKTRFGCEDYAYFNKYMITAASNLYMGILFADESIAETELSSKNTVYVFRTSRDFGKTFLCAGEYFLELDTNADSHYDANGLGRVHKGDFTSSICLSVPFPSHPGFVLTEKNPTGMSICCYAESHGEKLIGAEDYADYRFVESKCDEKQATAVFDVKLSDTVTVTHRYTVSEGGVDISLSGYKDIGFMIPVFDFDGQGSTDITVTENLISVRYNNAVCEYRFDGNIFPDFRYYHNRNGRYRVYSVDSKKLHIEINSN